jgi:hypothetical protein
MTQKFKKTLAIDSDGRLDLDGTKKLYYVDGPAGVAQELKTRLATIRGEDPFNPDFGLRIFEVTGAPAAILEREIRDALLEDERVRQVPSIEIERSDPDYPRVVEATVEVELVDGTPLKLTTGVNNL